MGAARLAALALAALVAGAGIGAPAPARAAEVRLEVEADRAELGLDEVLELEIRLEAPEAPSALELDEAKLPFRIVSRAQSRESSFSLGGGAGVQLRQVLVTRLGLAPRTTGDLVIPPVVATVRGQQYASKPITVKVLPAGASPPAPPAGPGPRAGSAFRGWERDVAVELQVDRTEAFLGEQVTASLWLHSRPGLVNALPRPPSFDGFWAEQVETPTGLPYRVRQVNGVPTREYLLARFALFPTRAGELAVGPFDVELAVRIGGDSPFDPFPEVQRLSRRTAPQKIVAKPLPRGAPPGFLAVNVGAWTLEAQATTPTVPAGQPVAIRVTATGEGNLHALALPKVPVPPGATAFEPTSSEKPAPRAGRLAGTRTVETVLVPQRTGELVVPPLEWPVFDPRSGRYGVLRTAELRVQVGPGAAVAAGGAQAPATNALAAGLRPIRSDGVLARRVPPPWRRWPLLAALALPPLAFAGLLLLDGVRARAGGAAARRRAAARVARRALARARRRAARGEGPAALAEVERALIGYAADRLGHPAAGLTREALAAALARAGAHPPAVRALQLSLDALDRARFGGGAAEAEVLEAAERALSLLEEADWGEGEAA